MIIGHFIELSRYRMSSPARFSSLRIAVLATVGIASVVATLGIWFRDEIKTYRQQRRIERLFEQADASPLGPENPPSAESFHPVYVLHRRPPITEFPVLSAAEADRKLDPHELVLGVEINGATRAYPLNMLNGPFREILNDHLGGRAIAATW